MNAPLIIRAEEGRDRAEVRLVNLAAFDTGAEANLVDALRQEASPHVSLVAEMDGAVVGHIMFSPVTLGGHAGLRLMGLAPVAVLPNHQRQGAGAALVRAGLDRCRQLGCGAVVVLGHPSYYPRFGFQPASRFGVRCDYDAPDEAFMLVELQENYLGGSEGTAAYHPAFKNL